MKRLLLSVLTVVFAVGFVAAASAGWNLRQNADGSTDWVNGSGTDAHVAESYVYVTISDVSTAITKYVVVPIGGTVETIYSVLENNISGADATLDFWVMDSTTPSIVSTEISNATSPHVIAEAGTDIGEVDTFTPTTGHTVTKGGVIAVHTDGGSTGTSQATITIIINPGN